MDMVAIALAESRGKEKKMALPGNANGSAGHSPEPGFNDPVVAKGRVESLRRDCSVDGLMEELAASDLFED